MKFAKGMIVGGMIAAGMYMMYADSNMLERSKKKMMKKGKQMMRNMWM